MCIYLMKTDHNYLFRTLYSVSDHSPPRSVPSYNFLKIPLPPPQPVYNEWPLILNCKKSR